MALAHANNGRNAGFDALTDRVLAVCRAESADLAEDLASVAAVCLRIDGEASVSDIVDATDLPGHRARTLRLKARAIIRAEALAAFTEAERAAV